MTAGQPHLTRPKAIVEQDIAHQIGEGKRITQYQLPPEHPLSKQKEFDARKMTAFEEQETSWTEVNSELLRRSFSDLTTAQEYSSLTQVPAGNLFLGPSDRLVYFIERMGKRMSFLQTLLKRLKFIPDVPEIARGHATSQLQGVERNTSASNDVVIVHGHDDATKNAVARFLERLKLKPIILHEQPSLGKTIIEKLEQYRGSGFAVILLTPDDLCGPRNVIFEMGFFTGAIGRPQVAAIYSEGVEIPTDYAGVVYIPMDSQDAWQTKLARELKAAGIDFDTNNLI